MSNEQKLDEQLIELLDALDELDKVEQDMALNMLMIQEYRDKKRAATHRVDKARRTLRGTIALRRSPRASQ